MRAKPTMSAVRSRPIRRSRAGRDDESGVAREVGELRPVHAAVERKGVEQHERLAAPGEVEGERRVGHRLNLSAIH